MRTQRTTWRANMGTLQEAEYMARKRAVDEGQAKAARCRNALRQHRVEHGCQRFVYVFANATVKLYSDTPVVEVH
jgi:hypothetical protein